MRQPLVALCAASALVIQPACKKEDPPPKPVLSSVTPTEGLTTGGLEVTLKGEFFDKASEVKLGGTAGSNLRVVDANTAVVTTPVHARGPVPVEITTPGGTTALENAFTYLQPVTVTSLEPSHVVALATTPIIVRGSGLVPPVTVTVGEGASAVTITARAGNDTAVPVDIPSLQPGTYTFKVTNADMQFAVSATPLIVDPAPSPVVGMVIPNRGPEAGGTNVRIQGQNFTGVTLVRFGTAVAVNPVVNDAGTEIVVRTPQSVRGSTSVEVTTPSGTGTLPNSFRYVRPIAVTSVTPSQVPSTSETSVTVVGTGLVAPVAARMSDGVNSPVDLAVNEQDDSTVAVRIPPMAPGDYSLTLSNADNETGAAPGPLLVRNGLQVDGIFPSAGFTDEQTNVEITGPDLRGVTEVLLGTAPCGNLVLHTRRRITCTAPPSNAATVDVIVRIGGTFEGRIPMGFEWIAPGNTTLRVVNVTPASGRSTGGQGVDVAVTGVGMTDTPSVTIGSVDAPVTARSTRRLTVTVPPRTLTAGTLSARVPVAVSVGANTDVQDGAFLYYAPATITTIVPNKGASVGGDEITIQGTAFTEERMRVFFDTAEATDVVRVSETELRCRIPAHALGNATVTVHNEFGPGVGLVNGFEFVDAVRLVTVTPAVLSVAGGAIVEVTGSGFAQGRMDLRIVDTNTPIPDVTVISPTRMRFTSVAHGAAGRVTLRLQDTARVGQPFSSGDTVVTYVDATDPSGAAGGGTIVRNISISVVRDDTRQRLAGATVFVGNAWSSATVKGVTNAQGMVVISSLDLVGPVVLTASLAGYANETIVNLDSSFVTFALHPRQPIVPVPTMAEVSGTIVNWQAAGYPQGAAQNRFKRIAVIYPSEPKIGENPPIPGDAIVISETACDISADGVPNPLPNQFTVRTPVGKTISLFAAVYFWDSVDGNCNPDQQQQEGPFATGGARMGVLANITPVAGSNPGNNIMLNSLVTEQVNVNLAGAPIAVGAPAAARTVDAIFELGESGYFTLTNPIGTQGTISFLNIAPQSSFFLLPLAYQSFAGIPTGFPYEVPAPQTVRALSAYPVMEGNTVVGYTTPLSEVYQRDPNGDNVTVSGFYDFISGQSPGAAGQLGVDRRFAWAPLSRQEGIVTLQIDRFNALGNPDPVWTVLMPAGQVSVSLPTVAGAPNTFDLARGEVYTWNLRGITFFPEDRFDYDERTNTIFERNHWEAHVISNDLPFTVP